MSDADEISDIKEMFAMAFMGFGLSSIIYGISMLQMYLYYRHYSTTDGRGTKFTVAVLFALDSLGTIFISHSLYTYWILNFGKDLDAANEMPWSLTAEKLSVTFVSLIAQCFYARMIWKASYNSLITSIVYLLAFAAFGLGIANCAWLFINVFEESRSFLILSGLVQGIAAFNNVIIAVCLGAFLFVRKRGSSLYGASSIGSVVDTLLLYIISRGILAALAQLIFLSLDLRYPDEAYWVPWHQAVGKLYVNSVLAALNTRNTFSLRNSTEDTTTPPGLSFVKRDVAGNRAESVSASSMLAGESREAVVMQSAVRTEAV